MNRGAAIPLGEVAEELVPQRRYCCYSDYRDSGVEWLGDVPAHWETWKLTHAFKRLGSGTTPRSESEEYYGGDVAWVTTSELRESTITDTAKKLTKKALAMYPTLRVYPVGTLLFAMYGATIGRLGILGIPATVNQACCAFSGPIRIDALFAYYWLQMRRPVLIALSTGGGQPNLSQDDLRTVRIPAPPLDEQRVIAAFLDRETTRIDELVGKKQRLIELLAEKRSALISHAVTKGLNPDAPMNESGIDWLGQVPEHWEVVPLRWHFSVGSGEYISNEDMNRERSENAPHPVIGGNGTMGFAGCVNTRGPTIVLGRVGALCGNVHLVNCDCWVTDNALRLSMIRRFDQGYLTLQLQAMDLNRWANTNAQPLITGGMVKEKHAALPPLTEQKAILAFFNVQASRLDELMAKVGDAIDKLREYRSALISAAVTGKIDVRGEVAL